MKKIYITAITVLAFLVIAVGCSKEVTPQIIDVPKVIEQPAAPEESQSTLSVVSTETIKTVPDVAYIYLGVVTKNNDANTAQSENGRISSDFITAIKTFGITDADIETSNINIYQDYDSKNYVVDNTYKVRINDIANLGAIIDSATSAGANSTYSLNFDVKNREELYIQALAKAMESAKVKAESMANAGGYKLVRPLSISEAGAGNVVYPMMATEAKADAGGGNVIPVAPSEIEISASINATYIIK